MKYSQAILVATLCTSALVAAVPLPSQNNAAVPPASVKASNTIPNTDSTNPAAVQGTQSLNGAPFNTNATPADVHHLTPNDANMSSSSSNNPSGTAPTPVASTPSHSGNDTPTRRDIGAIDMGLLTRVLRDELDARDYTDDSAMIARDLANDYELWDRGLRSDLGKVGSDIANLPPTVAANGIQGAQRVARTLGTGVQNFVNKYATPSISGGTGGTMSGTASPGATFRRDLELNARNIFGDSGTQQNTGSSLLGSVTQAARTAAADHLSNKFDQVANKIKGHMRATIAPGSQTPSTLPSSSYSGEEQGGFERRAPGQEGAGSLSFDVLNKRRNVEEYSVHERDFEDYDIYGRDLEIADLD
ncbi:hypothetical protein H0H93_006881 [Arthromyces matolae]|nr:hypothetical protein H0H93_006881 [Arthromyces matolae]